MNSKYNTNKDTLHKIGSRLWKLLTAKGLCNLENIIVHPIFVVMLVQKNSNMPIEQCV